MPRVSTSELPEETISEFNKVAKEQDKRSGAQQLSKLLEDYLEAHRQACREGKRLPQVGS